ncbi:MAG TPA: MMPL family transporter, partial [Streptosporangiaceae bacterium]|nr:MMPL family transporter [Streptosporangiaceae bacterium]
MRIHAAFRAIGSFAVRFRWFVLVAWIIAAVAVPRALPSLSSVTQGNNANFLPASAPSEHALKLAGPLGGSTLTPVPVVAASTQGTLTAADQAWLQKLQQDLAKVKTVVKVRDLGHSPDGQAAQLQVLSNVSQGADTDVTRLVKDLRSAIARDGPPSGLDVHLAGAVAIQVDQQAKSGSTDSQIQLLSIVFIIGLLLLVFRALLAPLVTLIPAVLAVTISGPLVAEAAHHGLKVSPLAQILLIVLVLGAGTDYGLFLVFRVRENLRAGQDRKQAVIAAVERVGESITFSAATVIAALLSLLAATFEFYSDLGIPLAIGIAVMLLAGLTLLPALMAIFGRAVFWPSKTQAGTGKAGVWGRIASRIVRHPAPTLVTGLVAFGALAFAVTAYSAAGFGGDTTAPAGSDSAAGAKILSAHFPNTSANPTNIIY